MDTTNTKKHKKQKILLIVGIETAIIITVFFVYLGIYYHADETAATALAGNESVNVTKIDGGYYFDGPSDDTALVFYPGAKVESTSYAPLMLKLAEAGIDCFIAVMPFNFGLFDVNAADRFIDSYDYDKWIVGGHSLGGVAASSYASGHTDTVDGLVLLASYSTAKIEDSIMVCSIYGSVDGCLNTEQYEKNRKNLPENTLEKIVEGGNHAGFGSYGEQNGDGTATISAEEQQRITANVICEFFAIDNDN